MYIIHFKMILMIFFMLFNFVLLILVLMEDALWELKFKTLFFSKLGARFL